MRWKFFDVVCVLLGFGMVIATLTVEAMGHTQIGSAAMAAFGAVIICRGFTEARIRGALESKAKDQ